MPWLRVDDTALVHPKVMHLRTMQDDVVTAERVVGWVMLCATWSGQQLTDCWLPEAVGAVASPDAWQRLAAAALKVRMVRRHRRNGQDGWLVNIDDGLFHLMSKEEVEKNRERRRTSRQDGPKIAVLMRDGDQCRYCLQTVNPKDNRGKSGRGREFDHPDPADRDTFVVACQTCNGLKWERTPEQAGLELHDPPAFENRHFHKTTIEWLQKRNVDPWRPGTQPDTAPRVRTGSQPAAAPAAERTPTRAAAAPEREAPAAAARPSTTPAQHDQPRPDRPPDQPPPTPADEHQPGRVGSGLPGPSPPHSRDGPRKTRRGTRGRSRGRSR